MENIRQEVLAKVMELRNPATEEIIDTASAANAADVERAVAAAQAAFPVWKKTTGGIKGRTADAGRRLVSAIMRRSVAVVAAGCCHNPISS